MEEAKIKGHPTESLNLDFHSPTPACDSSLETDTCDPAHPEKSNNTPGKPTMNLKRFGAQNLPEGVMSQDRLLIANNNNSPLGMLNPLGRFRLSITGLPDAALSPVTEKPKETPPATPISKTPSVEQNTEENKSNDDDNDSSVVMVEHAECGEEEASLSGGIISDLPPSPRTQDDTSLPDNHLIQGDNDNQEDSIKQDYFGHKSMSFLASFLSKEESRKDKDKDNLFSSPKSFSSADGKRSKRRQTQSLSSITDYKSGDIATTTPPKSVSDFGHKSMSTFDDIAMLEQKMPKPKSAKTFKQQDLPVGMFSQEKFLTSVVNRQSSPNPFERLAGFIGMAPFAEAGERSFSSINSTDRGGPSQ